MSLVLYESYDYCYMEPIKKRRGRGNTFTFEKFAMQNLK